MSASTSSAEPERYRVGDLLIDVTRARVDRDGREIALGKLNFDLLVTLVRGAPDLVSFDTLMRTVWPGLVVTLETVSQRVKRLRSALADDPKAPRYIGAVRGRGYRIIAPVELWSDAARTAQPAPVLAASARRQVKWGRSAAGAAAALSIFLIGALWLRSHSVASSTQAVRATASPSIAVMPFTNLTGDPAKDYLGDGIAEEVINTLIKVPGLKVPARTSSFAYKGRKVDIRLLARDLGVDTILEGSVREAGSRIRITAQLTNARDGLTLWSQTYDEQFTDLFKLQDDLATAIVRALKVDLNGASASSLLPVPPTSDVEAYDLYLQGSALNERSTPQSTARALEYFQRALDRDPRFARAYVGIASARTVLGGPMGLEPIKNLAAAEQAAEQALRLDPASAGAEGALAFIAGMRGQWVAGETHIRAELLLNPNDGAAHFGQGGMLLNTGHLHEALEEFKRAHELAPVSAPVAQALAVAYQALGRDTEALKPAQVAVDLGWDEHSLSLFNEQKAFRSGRYADAASAALFALNGADPDQRRAAEVVKLVYGALANPKLRVAANAARQRLYPANPATGGRSVMDTRPCVQSGLLYALLGDLDAAYDLANQCLDSAATGAIAQAPLAKLWMPQMHPFRSDPRFPAFAARLGLIQYWQRYGLPDDCATQAGKLTCE